MKSTWKRIWKILLSAMGWWALGIITLVIVLNLYTLPWTGFGDYTTPPGDFVRGKTLWDWMELLIIPIFLAAGAIAVNRSEKQLELQRAEVRAKLEREIAKDQQQEAALQSYLDRMAELLLKDKLRTARNKEVRNVARTRTLTVLRGLDTTRKGLVVRFLNEAGLISKEKCIVDLYEADLHGADLSFAHLAEVNLSIVNLRDANLSVAGLYNANLRGADLRGADLSRARLSGANLDGAHLENANLTGANLLDSYLDHAYLNNANLSQAYLSGAKVTDEQLKTVASLEGATLPDGTKHD